MAETVFQPHSKGSCFIRQLNISQDFGTETLEDHECLIFSDRTRQLETHGSWKEDGRHVTSASLIDSPPGAQQMDHIHLNRGLGLRPPLRLKPSQAPSGYGG